MHQLILMETEDIVAIKISAKLEKEDYDIILPLIEDRIHTYGKIKVLFELENFEGIGIDALWEDIKFSLKHFDNFSKVAVVGNKKWLDIAVQFTKPFTSTQIKYFESKDREIAIEWIGKP